MPLLHRTDVIRRRLWPTPLVGLLTLSAALTWPTTLPAQTATPAYTATPAPTSPSHPFPIPEALRPQVAFWKQVFGVLDSDSGVLHDPEDMTIIYHTWKNDLPFNTQERQAEIKGLRSYYQSILEAMADGRRTYFNQDEERVAAMFKNKSDPWTLRAAANSIRFQGGMRTRFAEGLLRSWEHSRDMEQIFTNAGLPVELTLLPHIESSFENRALSKVGAAGIWQIMPATARHYSLRVTNATDDRLDIPAATQAAAMLLQDNYTTLGTWPLAITAYNHGANGMRIAMESLGTDDFGVIVKQYRGPQFGFASQNFYAEFVAVVEIIKNYQHYVGDLLYGAVPPPGTMVTQVTAPSAGAGFASTSSTRDTYLASQTGTTTTTPLSSASSTPTAYTTPSTPSVGSSAPVNTASASPPPARSARDTLTWNTPGPDTSSTSSLYNTTGNYASAAGTNTTTPTSGSRVAAYESTASTVGRSATTSPSEPSSQAYTPTSTFRPSPSASSAPIVPVLSAQRESSPSSASAAPGQSSSTTYSGSGTSSYTPPVRDTGSTLSGYTPPSTRGTGSTASTYTPPPTRETGSTASAYTPSAVRDTGSTLSGYTPPPTRGTESTASIYTPPPSRDTGSTASAYTPSAVRDTGSTLSGYTPPPTRGTESIASTYTPSPSRDTGSTIPGYIPPTRDTGSTASSGSGTSSYTPPVRDTSSTLSGYTPPPTRSTGSTASAYTPPAVRDTSSTLPGYTPPSTRGTESTASTSTPPSSTASAYTPPPARETGSTASSYTPPPTREGRSTSPSATPVGAYITDAPSGKEYTVKPGDTLFSIAQRHGTAVATLRSLNGLGQGEALYAGQTIVLPNSASAAVRSESSAPKVTVAPVTYAPKATETPASPVRKAGVSEVTRSTAATEQGKASAPAPAARSATPAPPTPEDLQVKDQTIRAMADEQLRQYAEWLEVPLQRLLTLNHLSLSDTLPLGARLRLDFSKVSVAQFTERRMQYHRSLEEAFLRSYQISGVVTYKVKAGETFWAVIRQAPNVPAWLLQRYNPKASLEALRTGMELRVPKVVAKTS